MDAANVSAVVLGGGQSLRFGQEKGLAEWRGQSLVDHVLQRLPRPRRQTILVLRREQAAAWGQRPGVTVVHDHIAHAGPLRGVIRGLEQVGTGWAWVVACDQPLLNGDLLRDLLSEARPSALAVVPEWEDRLQPLTGLYHADAAAPLRRLQDQGVTSLVRAVNALACHVYPDERCRRHDPRGLGFRNVNRPADLDDLERTF